MGVKVSPNIAQRHITKMIKGLIFKDYICHIDDCGIWMDRSFEGYIAFLA